MTCPNCHQPPVTLEGTFPIVYACGSTQMPGPSGSPLMAPVLSLSNRCHNIATSLRYSGRFPSAACAADDCCPGCGQPLVSQPGTYPKIWACGTGIAEHTPDQGEPVPVVSPACAVITSLQVEVVVLRASVVDIPYPSQDEWLDMIRAHKGPQFNAAHEQGMRDGIDYARTHAKIVPAPVKHLPCPWCGSAPELVPAVGGDMIVMCSNKHCAVSPSVSGETPELAWAAWNAREVGNGQAL